MALTVVYKRDVKSARVNGSLGLHSVETLSVVSDASEALTSGTLCLHLEDDGAAVAEWAVTEGDCQADTRNVALAAAFSELAPMSGMMFLMRVKDGAGNLLGAGLMPVCNSCAEGEGDNSYPASGGPLTLEATVEINAGCPCKISEGLAAPCVAGDAEDWVGIALQHAEAGASVQLCRWGAAHVSGWGLTPAAVYYLPQTGQALSTTRATIALCVGYAQDTDTLVLTGGRLALQPRATGATGAHYCEIDATGRLIETAAQDSGGVAAAGSIPRLDSDGLLDASMIPAGAVVALARSAITDAVSGLSLPENPSYTEAITTLYRLALMLRAAQSRTDAGTSGAADDPSFIIPSIFDDDQDEGSTLSTWSSARILEALTLQDAWIVVGMTILEATGKIHATSTLLSSVRCGHILHLHAELDTWGVDSIAANTAILKVNDVTLRARAYVWATHDTSSGPVSVGCIIATDGTITVLNTLAPSSTELYQDEKRWVIDAMLAIT